MNHVMTEREMLASYLAAFFGFDSESITHINVDVACNNGKQFSFHAGHGGDDE